MLKACVKHKAPYRAPPHRQKAMFRQIASYRGHAQLLFDIYFKAKSEHIHCILEGIESCIFMAQIQDKLVDKPWYTHAALGHLRHLYKYLKLKQPNIRKGKYSLKIITQLLLDIVFYIPLKG